MLVSGHLLYLDALCALHTWIKPSKYRYALEWKLPILELEIASITHAEGFSVIKDTQNICMGLMVMTQDPQDICIILEQPEA